MKEILEIISLNNVKLIKFIYILKSIHNFFSYI